ncbi:unnamed protein product [Laminaria digitata]
MQVRCFVCNAAAIGVDPLIFDEAPQLRSSVSLTQTPTSRPQEKTLTPSRNVFFLFFCFPSHLLSSHFCLSPSIVVTQIRGHKAGRLFSPLPTTVSYVPSFLSREEFSTFFPRRLASNSVAWGKFAWGISVGVSPVTGVQS